MKQSLFHICCYQYILLLIGLSTCYARTLEVTIFSNSKPLENATICAGTIYERSLYQIGTTNSEGKYTFTTIPEGTFVITANHSSLSEETTIYGNFFQSAVLLNLIENKNIHCN